MNEIFVRTHNGVFKSGDTIYGVIYLKIATPTSARGVRLRLLGYEKYALFIRRSEVPHFDSLEKEHIKKWIDYDNIHVYQSDGGAPMAIGGYMFAFKIDLPQNLPGSCSLEMDNGSVAKVTYSLETEVLGCKNIKAKQILLLKHNPIEKHIQPAKSANASMKVIGGNIFKRIMITVNATLNKPEYSLSETMGLLLRFENLKKSRKNVPLICVEVIQSMHVRLKQRPASVRLSGGYYGQSVDDGSQSAPHSPDSAQEERCSLPSEVSVPALDKQCVLRRELTITDNDLLESGFIFHVPLSQVNEATLLPTTKGAYLETSHYLNILVTIEGLGTHSLQLPIQWICPKKNIEWDGWQPPAWTYSCSLIKSAHVCSVPDSVLATEVFAGFPGFQAY